MKSIFKIFSFCIVCCIVLLTGNSCKKEQYQILTTSDVNIVDYLRRYPDQFSEYVKVLDRTNISPFLNAYGAYTCFAPTNDAFKLYLTSVGKSSTDDIDTTTLKNICKLHLINDTIRTTQFTDGKIYAPTMYGQFLTTSVTVAGVTLINRIAALTQGNILTGNGYIHVIDHVLVPATLTVAKTVENNPKYSIFTQALKATGWYDSLNIANNPDTTRRFRSFLAESDSILKVAGFPTYAALKAKYNNTGNPLNPLDSLNLYMAYHILPGIKYVADIVAFQSHSTMAPFQVVTVTLDGQSVLLNQAVFNNVFEAGVLMDRPTSDITCNNGVVHNLAGDILVKIRNPYRVDFDPAAQPEIIKLTSIYRKAGKAQNFLLGQLKDITWQSGYSMDYSVQAATTANYYWWDDGIAFNLRDIQNNFMEFKTPLIVKGRYKVWCCVRRGQGTNVQVSVDGVALPRLQDWVSNLNTAIQGAVLEATGFKRYAAQSPLSNANQFATLAGVVDIQSTDRHVIRLTALKGGASNNTVTFDFFQFIPELDDQLRPTFNRDGTIVP